MNGEKLAISLNDDGTVGSGCIVGSGMVLCTGRGYLYRHYWKCPREKKRVRAVSVDEMWYGHRTHCCSCGSTWNSDEGLERQSKVAKRRAAKVAEHRAMWNVAHTRQEWHAWIRSQFA